MKRMIALILAALLLCTAAAAETVTVSVWTDAGADAVDVAMTLYESPLGLSMAYDPAHFAPDAQLQNTLTFKDYPGAFISFQANSDMTAEELADGLAVQSGTDECEINTTAIGGMFADELEVVIVNYPEAVEGIDYQHTFLLAQRSEDTLIIECYYPTMLDSPVGAEFTAMMQSIVVQSAVLPGQVQCEICGNWFEEGNEFRNHICISYPDANPAPDPVN